MGNNGHWVAWSKWGCTMLWGGRIFSHHEQAHGCVGGAGEAGRGRRGVWVDMIVPKNLFFANDLDFILPFCLL